MNNSKREISRLNMSYFIMLASFLGISLALSILGAFKGVNTFLALAITQGIAWLGLLIGTLVCRSKPFDKSMFLISGGIGRFLLTLPLIVIFAVSIMPCMWFLNYLSMLFVENHIAGTLDEVNEASLGLKLLVIAVMPAVSEELLTRGAFCGGLRKYNPFKAALISGIFFGVLHLNINQFLYATALGILIAILNECTGYIYSSMLVHFIFNGFSVVVSDLLLKAVSGNATEALETSENAVQSNAGSDIGSIMLVLGVFAILALIGFVFAVGALMLIALLNGRMENLKNLTKDINPGETKHKMFTLGFVLALILGFGYMIFIEFI